MKFSIQRAVSYHDQVHHYLKDMIIKGGYRPGERIYESKIAKELQVSRSPVREAIRTLEQEGLLSIDDKSKLQFMNRQSKTLKKYTNAASARIPGRFIGNPPCFKCNTGAHFRNAL